VIYDRFNEANNMVKATYIDYRSVKEELHVRKGWSLTQASITQGMAGIEGECGVSLGDIIVHIYKTRGR
jgi:hypothetical protein